MSDLPRFTEGNLGPINFRTINEMMERLDRVLPLLEDPSIIDRFKKPPLLNPFLVRTIDRYGNNWSWVEVGVRDGQIVFDVPYDTEGEPAPDLGRTGRRGTPEEESLGIPTDTDWAGGYATCFQVNDQLGPTRYILSPLSESSGGEVQCKLAFLTERTGEGEDTFSIENDGTSDGVGKVDTYKGWIFKKGGLNVDWSPDRENYPEKVTIYDLSFFTPDPSEGSTDFNWEYSQKKTYSFWPVVRVQGNVWVIAGQGQYDYYCK
jgi:hypothetical protein